MQKGHGTISASIGSFLGCLVFGPRVHMAGSPRGSGAGGVRRRHKGAGWSESGGGATDAGSGKVKDERTGISSGRGEGGTQLEREKKGGGQKSNRNRTRTRKRSSGQTGLVPPLPLARRRVIQTHDARAWPLQVGVLFCVICLVHFLAEVGDDSTNPAGHPTITWGGGRGKGRWSPVPPHFPRKNSQRARKRSKKQRQTFSFGLRGKIIESVAQGGEGAGAAPSTKGVKKAV
ncbi:hypothetical protein BJV74DRAFT_987964 [Russula compacta]|nr:hypothetical protein BJV74DRAFT_987964 [Russula compacta]